MSYFFKKSMLLLLLPIAKRGIVMKLKVPIIKTKFNPPLFKDSYIRRQQVMKKLDQVKHYPLTLLQAGAGYGKSATLSSLIHDHELMWSWYSIASQDDDFFPFFVHFIYSIRKQIPNFGSGLLQYLDEDLNLNYDSDLHFLCSELINELSLINDHFYIILDDFHHIENSKQIEKWFGILLEYLPDQIHLVISSRTKPTWDSFTRLYVKGNMLEIGKQHLLFTKEEIDVLFLENCEVELDEAELSKVYEMTEGWVIAIQMFQQQLNVDSLYTMNNLNVNSLEDLFRYLALEVYTKQPEDVKEFLLQTSSLDELSATVYQEVFGIKNAETFFQEVMKKNLFINHLGGNEYRYHALFKNFLQNKLKQDQYLYENIHKKIAKFLLKEGNYESAINHLLNIEDYDLLVHIIVEYGRDMVEKGKLEYLLNILANVPENIVDENYILYLYKADIYRYQCRYEWALATYDKTEQLAKENNNKMIECMGIEGQAKVYLDTIQPKMADHVLRKAIKLMEDFPQSISIVKQIELYTLMAENLLNLGKLLDVEEWIVKCKQLVPHFENIELESRYNLRAGKLLEAEKILIRGSNDNISDTSKSHRETSLLLSLIYSFMGEVDNAKNYALIGLEQGKRRKSPFVEACGWIRLGHSMQLGESYNLQTVINAYETALYIMEDIDVQRGKAEPLMGLCLLYIKHNEYRLAYQYGEKALRETEKVADRWLSSFIRLAIGISLFQDNRQSEAEAHLKECYHSFIDCGGEYGQMVTSFWLSLLYDQQGKETEFIKFISMFLRLIKSQQYHFFIRTPTLFSPSDLQVIIPLLLHAKEKKLEEETVRDVLETLGCFDLSYHPGFTLRIKTFGHFQTWLGDKPVHEKAWKREKAKEFIQLLTTKNKGLSKNEILSLLWPESDEQSAQRDFKVALNALNNAIEPDRKVRGKAFFVERSGSMYFLNPTAVIDIDRNKFEEFIHSGLKETNKEYALQKLKAGLRLYEGDYLAERPYEDWCMKERDRLKVLFLRGAERLAQLYVALEEFDEVIRYCDEMLSKDPCWEEAYRLLIYCYYRKSNRPYALKLYEKCCEVLADEFGVEPLETTKQMYEMVLEADKIEV